MELVFPEGPRDSIIHRIDLFLGVGSSYLPYLAYRFDYAGGV